MCSIWVVGLLGLLVNVDSVHISPLFPTKQLEVTRPEPAFQKITKSPESPTDLPAMPKISTKLKKKLENSQKVDPTTTPTGILPLDLESFKGKRVMFVGAHPDDAEVHAGGLMSKLQQQGTEIAIVIITFGNQGGTCYNATDYFICSPDDDKEQLAFLRRHEALAAGKFFGAKHVWRLGVADGTVGHVSYDGLTRPLTVYMRKFKPHIVFTHDPEPNWGVSPSCNGACPGMWNDLGYHPDHLATSQAVLRCVHGGRGAVGSKIFNDLTDAGIDSWSVMELYFFSISRTADRISHFVELEQADFDRKIQALALHKSQFVDMKATRARYHWMLSQLGKLVGVPLAETFRGFF